MFKGYVIDSKGERHWVGVSNDFQQVMGWVTEHSEKTGQFGFVTPSPKGKA